MIRLAVQDYCQECRAFCPAAYENISVDADGVETKVIEVRCERWELCANVARRSKRMETASGRGNVVNIHGVAAEVR